MTARSLSYLLLIFQLSSCSAQPKEVSKTDAETDGIRWMGFEEAVRKSESEKKKIFIDVYTDWCGWCKRMDATTFKNDTVIDYLNQHFHAVKLNAESRDTIRFRDQVFVFRPEYKANEIALSLLSGKMGYPSFVVLDENFSMLNVLAGYQTPEQLLPALQHFAENKHLNKTE
jgi:thioredoxin-related protein